MNLQTLIPLSPAEDQIDYSSKVLLLGSCFTENIGNKLTYFQFQNEQNPFGIVFNPVSLLQLIQRAIDNNLFESDDVFQQEEVWYSFQAHSSCSSLEEETLIMLLNERLHLLKKAMLESSHMIITLGTAWVYKQVAKQEIVANCHKVPQQNFTKHLLSVKQIEEYLQKMVAQIRTINSKASILFTVSPVRHIKDGFVENSQSKAHLLSAVLSTTATTTTTYFPAYEIVMDELRDYRYYNPDLIHLNGIAIEYIWEKFRQVWISPDTITVQKEVDTIRKGLKHKPFQPQTKKHQAFLTSLQNKLQRLNAEYPHFRWD